jgi:ribose transport system permease protein
MSSHKRSVTQMLGLDRFSALYLLVGFFVFFSVSQGGTFLAWDASLKAVLQDKVIVGVLALAFLVPLVAQTFDLSVGHMMGFSMVITNVLVRDQTWIPTALVPVLAILACAVVGFISGFFVVRLNVNSFIATLGISQVLTALMLLISGNRTINGVFSDAYKNFGRKNLGIGVIKLPVYFWLMILLALMVWFVLEHSPVGRRLFAVGGNPEAARLAGVNTGRVMWGSLVASATIAGFAGVVHTWKTATYDSQIGPGNLFAAVAAVFFGASQLRNRPNVWGAMIAMYSLAVGVQGLRYTFPAAITWIEPFFEGTSLLVAVALASRAGIVKVPKRRRAEIPPPPGEQYADVAVVR